ncbi:MAG: hypothetical protein E6Q97_20770 [Desulfurellales bacterium]|nr:MAG: hypothetical protein E6Q97_20770 [Desulfurellales bacterium]
MPSFAENRKLMNKGTGESSGVWLFEEFMFADSVFGRAVVEYDAIAKRIPSADREVRAFFSTPYEIEISDATVAKWTVFDDDGNAVLEHFNCGINKIDRDAIETQILEAFKDVEDEVKNFEMGLL